MMRWLCRLIILLSIVARSQQRRHWQRILIPAEPLCILLSAEPCILSSILLLLTLYIEKGDKGLLLITR